MSSYDRALLCVLFALSSNDDAWVGLSLMAVAFLALHFRDQEKK